MIECFEVVDKYRASIIVTFVNRAVTTMFPKVERMVAMGTPEFSFSDKTGMKVKETVTDFAFDLRSLFTVVEVEIL